MCVWTASPRNHFAKADRVSGEFRVLPLSRDLRCRPRESCWYGRECRSILHKFTGVWLTFTHQIKDYPAFLNDLAQTLRPGGMLILGDGEMQLYDEQRCPLPYSDTGASWTQKVFFAGYNAMKNRGGHVDCPTMNPTWLRSINSLTDVGWDKVFIPIGPWIYGENYSTCLCNTPVPLTASLSQRERKGAR